MTYRLLVSSVCSGEVLPADRGAEPAVSSAGAHPVVVQVHHGGGPLKRILPGSLSHHHLQPLQGIQGLGSED